MMQTRKRSMLEAVANVTVGYMIGLCSQLVVFPICGVDCSLVTNFKVSAWFTAISLVRQYLIRRWFANGDSLELEGGNG